jgi:GTPase SAR1 family protein
LAILNIEKNQIVIRLIYDGAPLSGKTTSLKALAGSFSEELYTPEELYGRTTYFDWVQHVGGLFEGYQLCCQVISVPGQLVWAARRQQLIDSADVIVFVGDTTRKRFQDSLAYLQALTKYLQKLEGPPVGIIFQANKRDLEDVVELQEMEKQLGEHLKGIAIVESIATESSGIRHAFVLAVRLCLDRVRELIKTKTLVHGKPEIENGEELLRAIKAREEDSVQPDKDLSSASVSEIPLQTSLAGQVFGEILAQEPQNVPTSAVESNVKPVGEAEARMHLPEIVQEQVPLLPTSDVASGMVWPPVEGRIILHEIDTCKAEPYRSNAGDWSAASMLNWHIHSYKESIFHNLEEARQQLIHWAHRHLATQALLSPRRCLALTGTQEQGWRIWQVVRKTESLRDYLNMILATEQPERIADGLQETASVLMTAAEKFAGPSLPCRIETISHNGSHIWYNSLMPNPALTSSATVDNWAADLIQDRLTPVLQSAFAGKQSLLFDVLGHLRHRQTYISADLQMILESIGGVTDSQQLPAIHMGTDSDTNIESAI